MCEAYIVIQANLIDEKIAYAKDTDINMQAITLNHIAKQVVRLVASLSLRLTALKHSVKRQELVLNSLRPSLMSRKSTGYLKLTSRKSFLPLVETHHIGPKEALEVFDGFGLHTDCFFGCHFCILVEV